MTGSGIIGTIAPDFIRKKHSRKLGVVFLLVVLVLSAGGIYVFLQTDQAVTDQARDRMEFSAESQARELSRVSTLLREESRLLSQSGAVRDSPCPAPGECPGIREFMVEQIQQGRIPDEVVGIHYIAMNQSAGPNDPGGPLVLSSTVEGFAGNQPDRLGVPWAQDKRVAKALNQPGSTFLTQPWRFAPGEQDLSVFAVISRVPQEKKIVVIMVSSQRLSSSMPRPAGNESFTSVVETSTGDQLTVLSHRSGQFVQPTAVVNVSGAGSAVGNNSTTPTAVELAAGGGSGFATEDIDNASYAVGYAPVRGTDWVVKTHIPSNEAFAIQSLVTQNLLILLGGAILALGAIVFTVGRRTSRSLARLSAKAEELQKGNLDTSLESNRIDEFGQLYGAFGSMRDSLRERIEEAQQARQRSERLNRHLEQKADEYSDVMRAAGEGDLTARMDAESDSDAMMEIATEFNGMIEELEATAAQLRTFSADVATASEEVTASVEEVRNASERVSDTTQSISKGAEEQNDTFQTVSDEMSDLSATTEEIAASSNDVAGIAEQSVEVSREGLERTQEAMAVMNRVANDAEESVDAFEQLQSQIEEIDDLTELIGDIAEQTNMLALNANIEASRAGSGGGGGGFEAVAQEIKELATEAKDAADRAEELIQSVSDQTGDTAQTVRETSKEVERSVETVDEVAEALDQVASYAEETSTGIQEVNDATDRQADSAQQVVTLVEEAAEISQSTATEAQDVAAATEEQTSALSEVARSVSDLSEQATRLRDMLEDFQTDAAEASVDGTGSQMTGPDVSHDGGTEPGQ